MNSLMSKIVPLDRNSRPSTRAPLHAFVADAESRSVMTAALQKLDLPPSLIDDGGIDAALRWVDPDISPQLLLVDLSASAYPVTDIAALMAATAPGTRVLAFGATNDVSLFRELVAAGASDYLVKPLAPDSIYGAIQTAMQAERPAPAPDEVERRIVAVLGSRGGIGTTTAAINVAWLLAHERKQKVGLIDLDLQFGTAALALDIEPGGGLWEALEQPSRVDTLFVDRVMVKESDNLYVLGAEEPLTREPAIDPSGVSVLLKAVSDKLPWLVVDLPRGTGFVQHQVLTTATDILLLCDFSVAGIRDATRLLEPIRVWAPEARLLTIAGRTAASLAPADFERHVGRKLDHIIPLDAKAVAAANNSGRPIPVVAHDSPTIKAFREVVEVLTGNDKTNKKARPFWRRLGR
jgi:pilus assembly protein CpaE